MSNRKIVVFDAPGAFGKNNLLFRRELIKDRHGLATCYLFEECAKQGIELMTTDLFFALPEKPKNAIFICDSTTENHTDELIALGVRPAILLGFEHPLYSCQFYWNLEKATERFDHTFMPTGARTRVSRKTTFHPWVSPQPYSTSDRVESNFSNKKFLTMISGNTRIHPLRRLYVHIMNFIKPLPTLVDRELYKDRLDAIVHFSKSNDFDFYGRGWDKPVRHSRGRYDEAVKKTWRGEVDDKLITLRGYKFSICFENAIYGGWITEKIIDCLFAGCVPIYWGAPDITDFIPQEAFIDFRKFKNFNELEIFLRTMNEQTYQGYIDAINTWIATKSQPFLQETYVADMLPIFKSYFQ